MKTLFMMRHGTAEDSSPEGDFHRALVDAGRAEAEQQGRLFGQGNWDVDMLLCSTAGRALETAQLFSKGGGLDVPMETDERLYDGSGEDLLTIIQGFPDSADTVLMVGHMPGIGHLLSLITTEHVDLAMRYAPATLCAIQIHVDTWDEADFGIGTLELYLPPVIA